LATSPIITNHKCLLQKRVIGGFVIPPLWNEFTPIHYELSTSFQCRQYFGFNVTMKRLLIALLLTTAIQNSYGQEAEKDKTVFVNVEFVFSTGVGNVRVDNSILDANYERTYAAKVVVGKIILPRLALGGMFMYDYYSDSGFLMVGPDIRYTLAHSRDFGVFVSGAGGYGFVAGDSDRRGGLFLYPSIGTTVSVKQSYSLLFSLGYKRQYFEDMTSFETIEAGETVVSKIQNNYSLGFLSFSVGLQF
jgi:hypothetical protein